jgi:hypothetical protein
MPTENINVVVVVSGQPVQIKANVHQKVEAVVRETLDRSGNKGQPPSDWELRLDGRLLDQHLMVAASGINDGATLFLSPKAGAGG